MVTFQKSLRPASGSGARAGQEPSGESRSWTSVIRISGHGHDVHDILHRGILIDVDILCHVPLVGHAAGIGRHHSLPQVVVQQHLSSRVRRDPDSVVMEQVRPFATE